MATQWEEKEKARKKRIAENKAKRRRGEWVSNMGMQEIHEDNMTPAEVQKHFLENGFC